MKNKEKDNDLLTYECDLIYLYVQQYEIEIEYVEYTMDINKMIPNLICTECEPRLNVKDLFHF